MPIIKYCLSIMVLFLSSMVQAQEIQWMSWEQAAKAIEKEPRKIFVDVYTNWCGWCKRMDATTFKDAAVVKEINARFYPVKLNAEQKESIIWQGQEFEWVAGGRDGINKLAYELLDGKLSYPTYVILDETYSRILISPGFLEVSMLMKELKYAAEDHYKTTDWETFKTKS